MDCVRKYGLLLALLLLTFNCSAQIDTIFWFAPPDLTEQHQQVPIRFCFSTYDRSASIVVDQPANPYFPPVQLTLAADSFAIYDFSEWVDSVETKPINTVLNRGFRVQSTTPISCYYESVGNNSEIYALKGTNGMGTDFLVPMQTWLSNYTGYPSPSSIEIIATEDSTRIEILSPVPLADTVHGTISANQRIVIWLDRGQSYAIRATNYEGYGHLANTRIQSNKPIVVNSTDDSVDSQQGCVDLIGDQIVPISMLGKRYVALRNNSEFERIYLFPVENSTHVTINGEHQPVLNQGSIQEIQLTDTANLIISDKPLAVFQITANSCELGGTMLPHFECTGSFEVKHMRSASQIIITIVTGTDYVSDFLLNGNANIITADDFAQSPYDSTISYCVKDVSNWVPYNSLMTLTNLTGRFQLGIIDGTDGGDCSYGFFSDYARAATLTLTSDTTICGGADYEFTYEGENVSNVTIRGANGIRLDHPPYVVYNMDVTKAGRYWIEADATSGCQQRLIDSVDISILPGYSEHLFDTIQEGETYIFEGVEYSEAGNYSHTYGANEYGCDTMHILHIAVHRTIATTRSDTLCEGLTYDFYGRSLTASGTYYDTIHASDLIDSAITLVLTVLPSPKLTVSEQHSCAVEYYTLTASTDAPYFTWSSQPHDSTLDGFEKDSIVQVSPRQATIYTATAAYQEYSPCPTTADLSLHRIATVEASLLATPNPPTYAQPLSVLNTSTGYYSYAQWHIDYDDRFHFVSSEPSLLLMPKDLADSIHIMLEIGNESCVDTAETDILLPKAVLYFPNIIMPGNDINDKFFCAAQGVVDFELWIYDRQGDVVFHTTDINFSWDGTHKGKVSPQAAYNYRCRYTDVYHAKRWQQIAGSVVLIKP